MTVCLAAICEDSQKVVVASDRMLTAGVLSLEFEHPRSKIVELSDSCVMMTAGSALQDIELQKHVRRELAGTIGAPVSQIVEKVKEGYQGARRKKIEELYLQPRGLTVEAFLQAGRQLIPEIAMVVDEQLATFDYGLEVLVAGVDNEGAHIYRIDNPGTSECFDSIGYHAIGSGEPHALYSLVENRHSHKATLQEGTWAVFEAKKNAERAPGVGREENFAVVEHGRVICFDEGTLAALYGLYKEAQEIRTKCFGEFKAKLHTIPIPKPDGGKS